MKPDKKLEELFIIAISEIYDNKDFIISALTLMNTDEQRRKILNYLIENENVSKSDLKRKMAYISVGLDTND